MLSSLLSSDVSYSSDSNVIGCNILYKLHYPIFFIYIYCYLYKLFVHMFFFVFVDTDAVMADQHTIDGRQVEAKRALPRDKTPNMSSGR